MARMWSSVRLVLLAALGAAFASSATAVKIQEFAKEQHQRSSSPQALLAQLEGLARSEGASGLTPAEKIFIQEIQELWKDEIMPGIQQAIAEGQNEISGLFEALLECDAHLDEKDDDIAGLLEVIQEMQLSLEDCVNEESKLLGEKDALCKKVQETKSTFVATVKPPVVRGTSHTARLQYLKDMNDLFCGADDDFKAEVKNCSDSTRQHAGKSTNCTEEQNALEAYFCEWQTEHSHLCQAYDSCRREALQRYNAAVSQVKIMEEMQQKDYQAAVRIECLWDAWDLAETPCLVDPDKVDDCYEQPVDLKNYTITYPLVPDAHPCSMDSEGQTMTHDDEDMPCTDQYLQKHYESLRVDGRTRARMTQSCKKCTATNTSTDVVAHPSSRSGLLSTKAAASSTTVPNLPAAFSTKFASTAAAATTMAAVPPALESTAAPSPLAVAFSTSSASTASESTSAPSPQVPAVSTKLGSTAAATTMAAISTAGATTVAATPPASESTAVPSPLSVAVSTRFGSTAAATTMAAVPPAFASTVAVSTEIVSAAAATTTAESPASESTPAPHTLKSSTQFASAAAATTMSAVPPAYVSTAVPNPLAVAFSTKFASTAAATTMAAVPPASESTAAPIAQAVAVSTKSSSTVATTTVAATPSAPASESTAVPSPFAVEASTRFPSTAAATTTSGIPPASESTIAPSPQAVAISTKSASIAATTTIASAPQAVTVAVSTESSSTAAATTMAAVQPQPESTAAPSPQAVAVSTKSSSTAAATTMAAIAPASESTAAPSPQAEAAASTKFASTLAATTMAAAPASESAVTTAGPPAAQTVTELPEPQLQGDLSCTDYTVELGEYIYDDTDDVTVFSYEVSCVDGAKDISHWDLSKTLWGDDVQQCFTVDGALSSNDKWSVGKDGRHTWPAPVGGNIWAIKSDQGLACPGSKTYTVALAGQHTTCSGYYAVKAGRGFAFCNVALPCCGEQPVDEASIVSAPASESTAAPSPQAVAVSTKSSSTAAATTMAAIAPASESTAAPSPQAEAAASTKFASTLAATTMAAAPASESAVTTAGPPAAQTVTELPEPQLQGDLSCTDYTVELGEYIYDDTDDVTVFSYEVSCVDGAKDISHWDLSKTLWGDDVQQCFTVDGALSSNDKWSVGKDGRHTWPAPVGGNIWAIKSDQGLACPGSKTYTVALTGEHTTCNGYYAVKAGRGFAFCSVELPCCRS